MRIDVSFVHMNHMMMSFCRSSERQCQLDGASDGRGPVLRCAPAGWLKLHCDAHEFVMTHVTPAHAALRYVICMA